MDSLYRAETLVHRCLPRWLFHPRYCFVYRLSASEFYPRDRKQADDSMVIRWATADDFGPLAWQAGEQVIETRLAHEYQAVTLWLRSQLVGTAWFALDSYLDDDTDVEIALGPGEAWLFGSWIHRSVRGHGYYSQLIQFAFHELQSSSITDLLFAVDATNIRSRRVHRALGATRCGFLCGLRLLGYSSFFVRTRCS